MERSCFWVCIVGSCRAIYTMRSFVLGWQKLGFGSEARDEFLKKRAVARSRKYCVFSFWPHIWPTIALLKEVSNFPSNLWVKFIMWPLSTVAQRSKIILLCSNSFLESSILAVIFQWPMRDMQPLHAIGSGIPAFPQISTLWQYPRTSLFSNCSHLQLRF